MTRLKKLKNLERKETNGINKIASSMMDLEQELLGSGDVIGLSVRVVNWKPWYQVYLDYGMGTSSFYDGPELNRAFSIYRDILLAFKGVKAAEEFTRQIPKYQKRLETFVGSPKDNSIDGYYQDLFSKKPKFLGYN